MSVLVLSAFSPQPVVQDEARLVSLLEDLGVDDTEQVAARMANRMFPFRFENTLKSTLVWNHIGDAIPHSFTRVIYMGNADKDLAKLYRHKTSYAKLHDVVAIFYDLTQGDIRYVGVIVDTHEELMIKSNYDDLISSLPGQHILAIQFEETYEHIRFVQMSIGKDTSMNFSYSELAGPSVEWELYENVERVLKEWYDGWTMIAFPDGEMYRYFTMSEFDHVTHKFPHTEWVIHREARLAGVLSKLSKYEVMTSA